MEVFKMLPEGTLAELIQGTLFMSPAPSLNHQRVVRDLTIALGIFVRNSQLGEIFLAPCDVFLDEHSNAVQPDIIYVSAAKDSIKKKDAIHGTPDLLIEILSPSNPEHDLLRKKDLYQHFGVKEYWIIDPQSNETFGFTLQQGKYHSWGQYKNKICSVLLNEDFEF